MEKIKSISQLKSEKKRMRQKQAELEIKIRGNWAEIKDSLIPANVAREVLDKVIANKAKENVNSENVFKNTLNYGITLLAKRFTDKAEKKFLKFFEKKAAD